MIRKFAMTILIFGMVLFFLGAVSVVLSGITWGWINGPVIVASIGVVVLIVGAVVVSWIIAGAESFIIRFALIFQALRRIRAETEKQETAAGWYQVMHPTGGAVAVDRNGRTIRLEPTGPPPGKAVAKEPDAEPVDDGPTISGPLLPVLEGMSRILLIGGMGAGKTELLRHLAWSKAQQDGHVIICDSHASPTTWPDFVQVAGIGRNYAEIEGAVNYVCDELDNRYKLRASGEQKRFEQLTLVVDELFVLNQFCDLKAQFKSLLAESRKVNIGLIVAGQSDRAGALGIDGNKDLIAGFEACVYLERLDNGQRVGFIRASNRRDGKYYLHPGPFGKGGGTSGRWSRGAKGAGYRDYSFTGSTGGQKRPFSEAKAGGCKPCSPVEVGLYDPGATGQDAEIIELYRAGNSFTSICKRIFGAVGGNQSKKIKSVLSKYRIA